MTESRPRRLYSNHRIMMTYFPTSRERLTRNWITTGRRGGGYNLIRSRWVEKEQDRCRGSVAGKRTVSEFAIRLRHTEISRASWSGLIGAAMKRIRSLRA